jgi:anti-sigma regulatory factor (Ser/Thr protein kinase)
MRVRVIEPLDAELPSQPICGALARRIVESQCGPRLDSRTLADLKLVVSELVINAYLHGTGTIWLKLDADDERVRVAVMDQGQDASIQVMPSGVRGGNGLRLVDHLCSQWGAYGATTHVWAELPIDPESRPG